MVQINYHYLQDLIERLVSEPSNSENALAPVISNPIAPLSAESIFDGFVCDMLEQPSAYSGIVSRKRPVRCSSKQHQSKTFVLNCHKLSEAALIVTLGHFLVKQTDNFHLCNNNIVVS